METVSEITNRVGHTRLYNYLTDAELAAITRHSEREGVSPQQAIRATLRSYAGVVLALELDGFRDQGDETPES